MKEKKKIKILSQREEFQNIKFLLEYMKNKPQVILKFKKYKKKIV